MSNARKTFDHLFATLIQKYRHKPVTQTQIRTELDGVLQATYIILQQLDELAKDQLALQIYTAIQAQNQSLSPAFAPPTQSANSASPPANSRSFSDSSKTRSQVTNSSAQYLSDHPYTPPPPDQTLPSAQGPENAGIDSSTLSFYTKKLSELVVPGASPLLISSLYLLGKFLQVPIGKYSQIWPIFVGSFIKSWVFAFTVLFIALASIVLFCLSFLQRSPSQASLGLVQIFNRLRDVCRCGWIDSQLNVLDRDVEAKINHLYATQDAKGISKKKVQRLEEEFYALRQRRDRLRIRVDRLKAKL